MRPLSHRWRPDSIGLHAMGQEGQVSLCADATLQTGHPSPSGSKWISTRLMPGISV
jgi:hypothetical protein